MTTVVLLRTPRDLAYHQIVRAICQHLAIPVSTETRWREGYGDIHIDLGDTPVDEARYAVELYTLTSDIEYRVLEDLHEARALGTRVRDGAEAAQWYGPHNSDPPRRTA